MRIIAGKYKGKRLNAPKSLPVRPTTDRAKEALFNILSNWYDFDNLNVLDLFCGTGNITYEFLSRNVNQITSIDKNYGCIKYVNKIINDLNEQSKATVLKADVFKFLEKTTQQYDIIFADPPYALNEIDKIPAMVFEKKVLTPDGILIVEHGNDTDLSGLTHFKEIRQYGNVNFSIFQLN